MNPVLRNTGKRLLSKILPDSNFLRYMAHLPKLNTWLKEHNQSIPILKNRYELYDYLNAEILKNEAVDYLEFGVYRGDSIKHWVNTNTHKNSRFWGFDTFTGLPTDWSILMGKREKGTFDTQGEFPDVNDNRCEFVKGMFQETLPGFLKKTKLRSRLVIHNDADIYSSTLYVLTQCNDLIQPGCILLFDEFSTVLDELRALEDYCSAYMKSYKVLCATKSVDNYFDQVAIEIIDK